MEKSSHRIGNSLYETGVYETVKAHSHIPLVGVSKKTEEVEKYRKSLATALAVGGIYWSLSHTDHDFYFTALSVLSKESSDNNRILYYFVFPLFKIMVPMSSSDILLFNPAITHSCLNQSHPDSYIFSSYVSMKTVLRAEVTMESERNKVV